MYVRELGCEWNGFGWLRMRSGSGYRERGNVHFDRKLGLLDVICECGRERDLHAVQLWHQVLKRPCGQWRENADTLCQEMRPFEAIVVGHFTSCNNSV